jgi:hypothetical protein
MCRLNEEAGDRKSRQGMSNRSRHYDANLYQIFRQVKKEEFEPQLSSSKSR